MKNLWREIKEIHGSRKDLVKFGVTLGIFFAVLAFFLFWRGRGLKVPLLCASGFFFFFAAAWPGFLRPAQKVWMALALVMGRIVSSVILTLVFYFLLTPIGVFLRITGKDFLEKDWKRRRNTYWLDRSPKDKMSYERQF